MKKTVFKKLRKICLISIIFTCLIYFINRIINICAVMGERLNKNPGKFYNWRYGKIFYKKFGSGKPLLLIHNLSVCSSEYEWNKVVRSLSENHTVYTLDLLGCGRSDKPKISYTNFLYVQLISDFVKNIIGIKTDVIASHNSSSLVIMTNQNNNELFNNIILINPQNLKIETDLIVKKPKLCKAIIECPIFGTFIYNLIMSKYRINKYIKEYYFYNPGKCSRKLINTYYESAHIGNANARFLYSSIINKYTYSNIERALKSSSKNIILIASRELSEITSIIGDYYSLNSQFIKYEWMNQVKLFPQLESPQELISILDNYLS